MVYPTFLSAICLPHNQPWTYLRGYSVIHAMLISAFNLYLTQKVTRSLLASLGPRALLLLLLLFVFNIYVLVVVITVISSVRRVITNDQRLTEYSRLYISNAFLSILAVPNKTLSCITPILHVMPSFPIHLSNSAETLPRAPITTGTISQFPQSSDLFFRILVRFNFFFFFFLYSYISWYSNINNYPLLFFLVNNY